jgi:hypothetical protein
MADAWAYSWNRINHGLLMQRIANFSMIVVSFVCFGIACPGAEFHVAADGQSKGAGSKESPWDLQTALNNQSGIKPGDTVWLYDGVYRGGFECRLNGSKDAPVTLRAASGERVIIDCRPRDEKDSGIFNLNGDWTVLWGVEFTCSDPKRKTAMTGSWPADLKRGGVYSRGSHNKLINLLIHDTGGVGFWGSEESGVGGEVYGCLVYYNGWAGPDRGHGHAIYAQNARSVKRIEDNILFSQFSHGLHCYGSEKAKLSGFHVEGNVSFNNGCLVRPDSRTSGLFLGGSTPVEKVRIENNFTYGGNGLKLGYAGNVVSHNAVVKGNYFQGTVQMIGMSGLIFSNNTVVAPGTMVEFQTGGADASGQQWDNNRYFRTKVEYAAFTISRPDAKLAGLTFPDWQSSTGFDRESSYVEKQSDADKIVVRPNRYDPGRAHVIVYNWMRKDAVELDLKGVLRLGAKFVLQSAQDFHGPVVVWGVYEGKPVMLPMRTAKPAQPVGMDDYALPVTEPEFGVYVLLITGGADEPR